MKRREELFKILNNRFLQREAEISSVSKISTSVPCTIEKKALPRFY